MSIKIANKVWLKYQDTGDENLRSELLERYLPLVRLHANRLRIGLPPHVSKEDLCQSGVLGLIEALQRFDPARGVKFETYAGLRIRGAMVDELRKLCWLPRSLVRQMRELDQSIQQLATQLGREPTAEEVSSKLGMTMKKYNKLIGQINTETLLSLEEILFSTVPGESSNPDALESLVVEEEKEALSAAIEVLPERYRLLLSLYYQKEMKMKEIGKVLGVTETRVCQLHARVISRLRTLLGEERQAGKE